MTNTTNQRKTFTIISHPDAGKTTLTEKLLLFGGAIQQAGAVKARGENRRARIHAVVPGGLHRRQEGQRPCLLGEGDTDHVALVLDLKPADEASSRP